MNTITHTQAYRYQAAGFTDDITTCDLCGKTELKGTVRLTIVDADGDHDGEIYAGVTCAARWQGKTAATVRTEARKADRAALAAWRQWSLDRHEHRYQASQTVLDQLGLERSLHALDRVRASDAYQETVKAWDAANPEPARPVGLK